MTGPAIKYYTILTPKKAALAKLNEAGAAGHMLCHILPRPDGTIQLLMAMPRSWDTDPWCPPAIQREIAKLDNAIRRFVEQNEDDAHNMSPLELTALDKARTWSAWIHEIMNPKPEPEDDGTHE